MQRSSLIWPYKDDPEVGKWLANTDFRRALALGIQRDQLNEVFFLGFGVPGIVRSGSQQSL